MKNELIVTLNFITSTEIHIYYNGLGLLPQNLIHYGDLDIVLDARAVQNPYFDIVLDARAVQNLCFL